MSYDDLDDEFEQSEFEENTIPTVVRSIELQDFINLFIKPKEFFTSNIILNEKIIFFLVIYCYRISSAIERIDTKLIRSEYGNVRASLHFVETLAGSWFYFWPFVLISGLISGYIGFYIGSWWYNLRLKWSTKSAHDKDMGSYIFMYCTLIYSLPTVLLTVANTVIYKNHLVYYQASNLWELLFLVFPFWSVISSYRTNKAVFNIKKGLMRFWFLILPILFYIVDFIGVIAAFLFFL